LRFLALNLAWNKVTEFGNNWQTNPDMTLADIDKAVETTKVIAGDEFAVRFCHTVAKSGSKPLLDDAGKVDPDKVLGVYDRAGLTDLAIDMVKKAGIISHK
jgi:hypothetical protein